MNWIHLTHTKLKKNDFDLLQSKISTIFVNRFVDTIK